MYWDNHILVIFIFKNTLYESHQLLHVPFSSKFIFIFPVCVCRLMHIFNMIEIFLSQQKERKKSFLRTNRSVYVIAYNLDDNDNVIKKCRGGKRRKKNMQFSCELNLIWTFLLVFDYFAFIVFLFLFTFIDKLPHVTSKTLSFSCKINKNVEWWSGTPCFSVIHKDTLPTVYTVNFTGTTLQRVSRHI